MSTVIDTGVRPTDGALELAVVASGLEPEGQLAIRTAFSPFWIQAAEWKAKIDTVTDPKVARASRLLLRKIRIEATYKKDELKTDLLKRTRAIDGAFRAIESTITPMEEKLDEIEKAEERRIAAAKAALKAERDAALRQYGVDVQWIQTGEMSDKQFLGMLEQAKAMHLAKIEAERAAKEKAEAEAKADAEERERARIENERLRKEAAEREAAAKAERDAAAAKLAEERKARAEAEEKALAERKRAEAEAAAKLKAERDAREKLEKEAAAAKKAEAERIAAEKAAAARAAAAPDAAKLWAYADGLDNVVLPGMATEAGKAAASKALSLVEAAVLAIKFQAKQLEAGA